MASVHDTILNSSFVTKTCLDNQGIIDGSSIWTFSDIFEEVYFFPEPFLGGFGLVNIYGIPKPCFWAFKLMSELGDTRYDLPYTNDKVEIALFKKDNDDLQIMLYAQDYKDVEENYDIVFNIKCDKKVDGITYELISKEYGNPIPVWQKLGSPRHLKREQVEYIKENSKPKIGELTFIQKEKIEIKTEIKTNEVMLITVKLSQVNSLL